MVKHNPSSQKLAAGLPVNVQEVTRRVLEAEDHENIEALMQVPPPQPDPEIVIKGLQIQANLMLEMARLEKEIPESQMQVFKDYAQAMVNLAKAQDVKDTTELTAQRDLANAYIERKRLDAEKEAQDAANRARATAQSVTSSAGGSA